MPYVVSAFSGSRDTIASRDIPPETPGWQRAAESGRRIAGASGSRGRPPTGAGRARPSAWPGEWRLHHWWQSAV